MKKNVAIGIQDFKKIITNHCFYIDKTLFIKEWWERQDEVTLITRPRRFGKTLNMSMLDYFFSLNHTDSADLFHELAIWQEEKYRQLQGTYPVISVSFATVKEPSFELARQRIYQLIQNLYSNFEFLLESDSLSVSDKNFIKKMSGDITDTEATFALHQLSKFLHQHYKKRVILLLDEYDTPMQEAYVYGYWKELAAFTRSLLNSSFKTNPYLERAIMTGITRISKESIFSDLNNLKIVTTTSPEYATAFGFTEEEVFAALEEHGFGSEKTKIKKWYDGFVFGSVKDIYNPWSIINFLDTGSYAAYWTNTSSNNLISRLVQKSGKEIKTSFENLLCDQAILCPIDEQIVYDRLDNNEAAIWSLLLAAGYLKVLNFQQEDLIGNDEIHYEMALTNFEVKRMFFSMIRNWFTPTSHYNDFVQAMLQNNLDAMNEYINRMTLSTFSYFDTGYDNTGEEPERFYHGFVLGLIVDLEKDFIITSNRESGFGRYDVMLEPRNPQKFDAFILEFKVLNRRKEKSLEDAVAQALAQIEERQYDIQLRERGIAEEKIHKYGIAFDGKRVLVEGICEKE